MCDVVVRVHRTAAAQSSGSNRNTASLPASAANSSDVPSCTLPERFAKPTLLRFLSRGTLVSAPVGQPVVFAFLRRRLVGVLTLTARDNVIHIVEATVDAAATSGR
ncbi:hypothetical protein A5727_05605 [Mycobacterium sp. ACS4331]|nr:hypothetical protein A5727_05605 [Mycobacterium sp. ACS4331]